METKLKNLLQKLREDERGLSTVEYVVLLVLIVAIAVALWNVFGNLLVTKLSAAAKEFDEEVVTSASGSNEATDTASAGGAIDTAAGPGKKEGN